MVVQTVERALYYASLVLTVALFWKIWRERLHLKYRFLALYLLWNAIGGLILLAVPRSRATYFYVYTGARFVQWILDVLVTLDVVAAITKRYQGISTAARVGVTVCLSLATGAALLTSFIDLSSKPVKFPILQILQLVDRTISFSVLAFFLLILAFLLWFPIRLSRNTVAYAAGFIVVFAARFSTALLSNLLGESRTYLLSACQLGIFSAVLIFWMFRITRKNELDETIVGHRWNLKEERRLIGQLETANDTLLRGSSKVNSR